VDKSVWKKAIGEDAYKEVVGSCDRCERGVCAKKGKGVSCYDLKLKGLSNKTTLVLSNIRELNRVPNTK